ncbi:deoxyribodipyrimidine photo-lyase [Vibrio hepatarius]|uniref:deoxyribodipyrimidine photo-lyase n=1 Tax=Vibrio hepatarius TaxID=171383 RepID=UPI0037359D8D
MKIVWLRRDLRVDDNTALVEASLSGESVAAVYIATPKTWQRHGKAPIQADLIYRRLTTLQHELSEKNIPLYYLEVETYHQAAKAMADLALENKASAIYFNNQYEVDEIGRDKLLCEYLQQTAIECVGFDDKCVLPPGMIVNKQGEYYKVFTPFKRAYIARLYQIPVTVRKVSKVESIAHLSSESVTLFGDQCDFSYPRTDSSHYLSETQAIIQKLRDFDSNKVDGYDRQRDFPFIEGTSELSPYLAIGALSIRQCLARLLHTRTLPISGGREVWLSELVWREFYQHLLHFEPKLSKGHSFTSWGDGLYWHDQSAYIEAWKSGQTGYPIVDAAMRQLNHTGWMHNRLRMIVASFLVKDLHVDWRVGERHFISKLVDGDYAANNGGWQWCASTGCDGQPYFRIFNPTTQSEKFDSDAHFIRRWVPELEAVPKQYIHKPWCWPNAKSLSYPSPIVDHRAEREITLALYKDAKENMDGA